MLAAAGWVLFSLCVGFVFGFLVASWVARGDESGPARVAESLGALTSALDSHEIAAQRRYDALRMAIGRAKDSGPLPAPDRAAAGRVGGSEDHRLVPDAAPDPLNTVALRQRFNR
jgi:hypothetical protein